MFFGRIWEHYRNHKRILESGARLFHIGQPDKSRRNAQQSMTSSASIFSPTLGDEMKWDNPFLNVILEHLRASHVPIHSVRGSCVSACAP